MLVLDAGAFVAVERGDRDVVALVKRERLAGARLSPAAGWWRRSAEAAEIHVELILFDVLLRARDSCGAAHAAPGRVPVSLAAAGASPGLAAGGQERVLSFH